MTGVVYVAQGAKILKVGRTTNVIARKHSIRREFARFADEITNFRVFEADGQEHAVECTLLNSIQRTHKRYMGREWFVAGDFEQVCMEAEKACDHIKSYKYPKIKPLSEKERLRLKKDREDFLVRQTQQREEQKLKREQESRQKKLIRVLRAVELDCIAMWKRLQVKAS